MQTSAIYADQAQHGATSAALCIPDAELHHRRLRLAAALLSGLSIDGVVDIGCGFGDLRKHLRSGIAYAGIDVTPQFIEQGRKKYPEALLIEADAIGWLEQQEPASMEAVVALGVLATCDRDQMRELLCLMRRAARRAVVVSWQELREYRGSFNAWHREDVEHWLGRCKALSSSLGDTEYTGAFIP